MWVQLFCTRSTVGVFDYGKDTDSLNKVLQRLQADGARILDVKASISRSERGATALYIILYEAPSAVKAL